MSFGFGFGFPSWRTLAGGFSPAALFVGGVQGAWYDPSDLSTMFTTDAGTTPVAMPGLGAAVSVGLMLDKSQGATPGSELVTNGNFSSGTTGWSITGAWAEVGGQFVKTGASTATASQSILTVGRWYTFSINVVAVSTVLYIYAGSANSRQITTTGVQTFTLLCSGDTNLYVQCIGSATATVDNISVRELPGNHAIAFNNTTARPELRARVNLLTYSEEFDNAYWQTASNVTITANAGISPDGTTTAELMTEVASTATHRVAANGNNAISGTSSTATYKLSCFYKANAGAPFALLLFTDGGGSNQARAWFNLSTGVKGSSQVVGNGVVVSYEMTPAANGYYLCSMTCIAGSGGQAQVAAFVAMADADLSVSYAGSTGRSVLIWGADLRPANIGANVPAYQRIADANTYDTSGFPLYLFFDGIDDSMYTPANLNLSGTDKVAVFAGVRKLSDAATGIISEFSASVSANNGTFFLTGPFNTATPDYSFASKGTSLAVATPSGYASPITNILTGTGNISGDSAVFRVNGVQAAASTSNQGTGNYGTYPLFIGARNNSSLWLNGHLHSLIIAGSAVSAGNISATEQWVANKTGIVIP